MCPSLHTGIGIDALAGLWIADLSRSRLHPANVLRNAVIDISVEGTRVTFRDFVVDANGREDRDVIVLFADGVTRHSEHGYSVTTDWDRTGQLRAVTARDREGTRSTFYKLSRDLATLTIADSEGAFVSVLHRAETATVSAGAIGQEHGPTAPR